MEGSPARRVLVVTAVAAERDAVTRGVPGTPYEVALPGGHVLHRTEGPTVVDVLAAGVGPAAAGAGTATALTAAALAGAPYELAVSAGIGGGFTGGTPETSAPLGATVVADSITAADLGSWTPTGFLSVSDLGFGTAAHIPPPALVRTAAGATGALVGEVLTVSAGTGTAERAAGLLARHPRAAAEAMEGFGVAEAATAHGLPALEIRTISNAVGPRDRGAWRIPEALAALTAAFGKLYGT